MADMTVLVAQVLPMKEMGRSGVVVLEGAYGVGEVELSTPNNNRDWDLAGRNLPWFPTTGQAAFVYGQRTHVIPATTACLFTDNMGSALLIQHLKITTKLIKEVLVHETLCFVGFIECVAHYSRTCHMQLIPKMNEG